MDANCQEYTAKTNIPNVEDEVCRSPRAWIRTSRPEDTARPALICAHTGLEVSYGMLQRCLDTFASHATRGTRYILLFERYDYVAFAHALLVVLQCPGAVACPLDPAMSPAAIKEASEQLGASAVITGAGPCAGKVTRAGFAPSNIQIVQVVGTSVEWTPTRPSATETDTTAVREGEGGANHPRDDEVALLLRTSGTTSKPQIVPLTAKQLHFNALALARSMKLARTDISLLAMPLFHIGGLVCGLLSVLVSNSSVILQMPFDPALFFALLQAGLRSASGDTHLPTWYYAAPTIHKALLLTAHAQGIQAARCHSLRLVRSGAAHLPHSDALALQRLFQGAVIMPTYSMSECMPVCSVGTDHDVALTPDVVGRAVCASLRIVDPATSRPLPYGEVGEICVKGFGVSRMPAMVDGWYHTGDLGTMCRATGAVSLRGRLREMIKVGGEQVSLFEVEEAVMKACESMFQTVVAFGVENSFWGHEVAIAVVLADSTSVVRENDSIKAEVYRRMHGSLERWKLPKQVVVVDSEDAFPRAPSGKFLRRQMATHLNVSAVDLDAERKIGRGDVLWSVMDLNEDKRSREARRYLQRPSSALHSVRFIAALWVAHLHIGWLPTIEWNLIRSFTLDMTIFVMLAGFQVAAAITRPLVGQDAASFRVTRIAALHGSFLFALFLALPVYLAVNIPGLPFSNVSLDWFLAGSALSILGFMSGIITTPIGLPTTNMGPFWF